MKHLFSLMLVTLFSPAFSSVPNYISGPGAIANNDKSCPTTPCVSCSIGKYNKDCGVPRINPGVCTDCPNAPPINAVLNPPSFSTPCDWKCMDNFVIVSNMCAPLQSYATTAQVALPLTPAEVTSNIQSILASIAALAGCGTCPAVTAVPKNGVQCGTCLISIDALTVRRRLLAASTTLSVSIIQASSAAAQATVANLNTAGALDQQLASQGVKDSTGGTITSSISTVTQSVVTAGTTGAAAPTTAPPPSPATTTAAPQAVTTAARPTTTAASPTTAAISNPPAPRPTTTAVSPLTTAAAPPPPPASTAAPAQSSDSGSSGSSNGALIGGAVAGVVVVLGIVGVGVYFALKAAPAAPPAAPAAPVRAQARFMQIDPQVYTRAQRLPGQPLMGQRPDMRFAVPGAPARQPPQLDAPAYRQPPQLHPQTQQQYQPLRQIQQRPRFYTAPAPQGPHPWA
jgi:hypothetical protein